MTSIPAKISDAEEDKPVWRTKVEKIQSFLTPLSTAPEETESKSRGEFMKRLETYKPGMWIGKPVSPPQCARYGWTHVRENILHCSTCGEYLCADLPSPSKLASYKFSCEKLQDKIITSHGKFCSWPSSPDSESVLGLLPLSNKSLIKVIKERVMSMEERVNGKLLLSFDLLAEEGNQFLEWISKKLDVSVSPDLLKLVLSGWHTNSAGKLVCTYCSRSWVLDVEGDELPKEDNKAPEMKRLKLESSDKTNPLSQHQAWCAWRHKELGWTTYLDQLKKWHAAEQTETRNTPGKSISDALRRVRQMFQTTETFI